MLLRSLVLVGLLSSVATAAPQKIRSVEGITEYRLANGLQVLLYPDATQSTVTVSVTYLVGSRFEGYGETGWAHLLEHMMFKGTPRHRNVTALFEERGGEANGTTDVDRTNYFETLPASPENLAYALDVEADRMTHASISREDLQSELTVVRNELETNENDPEGVLDERISESAFLWHAYGRPTIGARTDIERVQPDALRRFYTRYYQPDNAVLVVAGTFDEAGALAAIDATIGAIARPVRQLEPTHTVEPVQDGERAVTLRRTGDVAAVGAAYHGPAGAAPDFAAFEAAVDILVHEPSGRLYKPLVASGLATSLEGTAAPQHDPFLGEFFVQVRDAKNLDAVERALEAGVEGLGQQKLEQKELDRWRRAQLKKFRLALSDSTKVAVALSEYIALGDWRTLFAEREAVKQVTLDDVKRVAQAYFKPANRTSGRFVPTAKPDRAPYSEPPDVAHAVAGIVGGEPPERGEQFTATFDSIEARVQRATTAGGLHATLLPKKTRGGKVRVRLELRWGDAAALAGKRAVGELLGDLLGRGSTSKSYQDVQDKADELDASIDFAGSVDGVTVDVETVREHVGEALDLVGDLLVHPALAPSELEIVRQELLAQREQQVQDPGMVAFATLAQIVTPWPKRDPRFPALPTDDVAELKTVTLADVRAQYARFAGASHGELTAVGDFDPAELRARADKLLGKWPSKAPYARLAGKVFGLPGQQRSVPLRDKEQTTIAVGYDLALRDTDPDYPAWVAVSQVLGGYTGSRLWTRLREHEGLSYNIETWVIAGWDDDAASFDGVAIVAPQNLSAAKRSLNDELSKLSGATPGGEITADELQRAKDALARSTLTQLSSDETLVQLLTDSAEKGRTLAFSKDLLAKIAAVTPADATRVAKKLLDVKRLSEVDAGDPDKAK